MFTGPWAHAFPMRCLAGSYRYATSTSPVKYASLISRGLILTLNYNSFIKILRKYHHHWDLSSFKKPLCDSKKYYNTIGKNRSRYESAANSPPCITQSHQKGTQCLAEPEHHSVKRHKRTPVFHGCKGCQKCLNPRDVHPLCYTKENNRKGDCPQVSDEW